LLINEIVEKRKQQKNSTKLMEDLLDNLLAKSTLEELGCDNMTAVLIEFLKP
jgi:serine/threonine protein phosphatase PrpC